MQERRRAEMEQRDREFQAMKDDAAYTERLERENHNIMMQNLKNEGMQQIANAKGEAAQAAIDNQAIQTIMGSIADFSSTAAEYLAKEEAEKRKKKQEADNTRAITAANSLVMSAEQQEQELARRAAEDARDQGGIQYGTDINVDGVLRNEEVVETRESHVTNPAFTGASRDTTLNTILPKNYLNLYANRLGSTERLYTAQDGTKFSGAETKSSPYLSDELRRITTLDQFKLLGITDPAQVAKGLKEIDRIHASFKNSAVKEKLDLQNAILEQRASDRQSGDTTNDQEMAFQDRRLAFGFPYAHDKFEEYASNAINVDIEVFRQARLKGTNKTYDQEFPKRWAKIVQKRNDRFVKQQNADEALKKAEDREWVNSNIDAIQEAYNQNPNQAAALIKQRYHGKGMTVPPVISRIESAAIARNKDLTQHSILERTRFGILDLPFVNSIRDPQLQKQAREAYNVQEERKYGPESLGIKKGFKATARALTKINPNEEQGSAQTFLVQARLESEYLKQLELTNDPLKALENVNKMVDAGNAGDKSSPFYIDPGLGDNNRPVFPNIESSDREVAEMNTYIDKQLLQSGTAVVDKPFAIANANQMDAAYTSSLSGSVKYPPGILKVADQFGLKPSEVFNAHRQANNAATGANKPLLTPSPVVDIIDNSSPEMRKLFLSEEPAQINRASAVVTGDLGFTRQQRSRANDFISMASDSGARFPELVAAQMILESAFGTVLSGTNNFFGMKATSSESSTAKQTTEFRNGVEGAEVANFKNYGSPKEAVNDLVSKWYKDYPGYQGVNNASSIEEAAMMLQQQGYATDPNYAQKLIQIANRLQ